MRLVEVGQSVGPTISLPAADVLRSSGLEIYGSGAGTIPLWRIYEALPELVGRAANGEFSVDVERVPLEAVEKAWSRDQHGRRLVLIP